MKKNLLVTLADENYIDQAKQLFSSVYWNAGWKGDYMLLAHEIPEKDLRWFREKGILIKKCDSHLTYDFGRPSASLNKFCLFSTEFKKWSNIVYLDGDIIVRSSIDNLTKVNNFAAVPDFGKPKLADQLFGIIKRDKRIYDELSEIYDYREPSFNAGVLAFNTGVIKKDTFECLNKLASKYYQHGLVDQPILNLYFCKKWERLSYVYNVQVDFITHAYKPKKVDGAIIHFTCKPKPWASRKYYDEWKHNLDLADKIDLNKIPPTKKKWTQNEIKKYNFSFRVKNIFYLLDKQIGRVGMFLKLNFPSLYKNLKKIIY